MSTILALLIEKWEENLDTLQRLDETITPLREAMDLYDDDTDISTLEVLPNATLSECVCVCGGSVSLLKPGRRE
tara:strand:- start:283 stop:504 length:222 start_codon:yes stop_codon:yes gene_type:complete